MQTEDGLEQLPLDVQEEKPAKSKKALLFWLHGITFALGLGLLVLLIWWIGYKTILESLAKVGWGFIAIIALNVLRHFLRAASMYLAVPKEHRTFRYMNAVAARFGGEAVSFLTFTGPFLGDATKAVLLRKKIPLTHSASAVLIDNVLYYVTVVLMIIAGVIALVYLYGANSPTVSDLLIAIVIGAVIILVALLLAIWFQIKPLSHLIGWLDKRGWVPKKVRKVEEGILRVETNVFEFYRNRTRDFFLLGGISSFVHFISVCEVYLSLKLLGFESFWSTAFIIESLTKVINVVFSFVPGTIGVYEGGNGFILLALGYTTAVGVALALVRRGAILFSLFVGLAILLWRILDRGTKTLAGPDEA
jgi:uncharacterized membrane protein YbhN (UPF0104 family)